MRRWETHRLRAWRDTGDFHAAFANVGFPVAGNEVRAFQPDLIVYDATALAIRQLPTARPRLDRLIADLEPLTAVRIAAPLDEFLANGDLNQLLVQARVDRVYSPAPEAVWPTLYPAMSARGAVAPMLTAYIDDALQRRARRYSPPGQRPIWLGYRTCEADPRFGSIGRLKSEIGSRAAEWATARGLPHDVRGSGDGVKLGDDWMRFLRDTRVTVGVEGGADVLDIDGGLAAAHQDASVAWSPSPTSARLGLRALSPRHLEAAACGTGQVLVRGNYSGVLEPGIHYVPVDPDLGDLDNGLNACLDDEVLQARIEAARRDLVVSDRYTWRRKLRDIRSEVLG